MWGVINPIPGIAAGVPVVSVAKVAVLIEEIHFATPDHGNLNWFYLYESVSKHAIAPGVMKFWAAGNKIDKPEWGEKGKRNLRSCWTRGKPVSMKVKLVASIAKSLNATLVATPKVDGNDKILGPATVKFSWPAGSKELWVNVPLTGNLPTEEIGRYLLTVKWEITSPGLKFGGPILTNHRIYSVYGPPLDPDYDSNTVADTGAGHETKRDDGTLSGTRMRLDFMMGLIGGTDMRHKVTSTAEMVDLYWKLHVGINDTPGAPPYFNGNNSKYITIGPDDTGTALDIKDQWLGFVPAAMDAKGHTWNDASCIGHVQIMKTMLAAVGLFSRRTWIYPHTTRMPDGTTVSLKDTDLFDLGKDGSTKQQTWKFKVGPDEYRATPGLIEVDGYEQFEACMLSPTGKFLTGGYATSSNPKTFTTNKGFNSATELLRWWCNTTKKGFKRFMAWCHYEEATKIVRAWDVDGKFYDWNHIVQIRDTGKKLPVP